MRKFTLLALMAMLFIGTSNLNAQVLDARELPYFIDAEKSKIIPRLLDRANRFVPNEENTVSDKDVPKIEKMLNQSGIEIVPITQGSGNKSETFMTINPQNPNVIVASSNDTRYNHSGVGYRMAAYYSHDGGKTWGHSTTKPNMGVWINHPAQGSMTNFDPAMAFDTKGNIYYSFGFCQVESGDETKTSDNGVFVARSTDGGITWQDPYYIAIQQGGGQGQPFHDRYIMGADVSPTSPYKDRIYVTWQRFGAQDISGVVVSYIDADNYEEGYWSNPQRIGTGTTQSPMPVTGPNGEVYVAWQARVDGNSTQAVFQRSLNGGASWMGSSRVVQTVRNPGTVNTTSGRNVLADKQSMRVSSYPVIGADCSDGPRRGWIYVAQAGKDNQGIPGLFLARSTDGGDNWVSGIKIDENTANRDVFFPSISVDPVSGLVAILYYTSKDADNNSGLDAYVAVSFDGENFNNIRLTSQSTYISKSSDVSHQGPANYYWGDYTDIKVYNSKIYPCYWWPVGTNPNFYTVNMFTALMSTGPQPPTNLAYDNNWNEPNKVILTWEDPTQNQLGGILSDFKVLIFRNGDFIDEVAKGLQTYTDMNAPDGQYFTYLIKVKTTDGQESPAVNISGYAGGALKPLPPTALSFVPNENGVQLTWLNPALHIDNSFFHDFEKINIYLNDEIVQTVNKPNIATGEFSSAMVSLQTNSFHLIKITAVGKRGETLTESDFSDEILVYAGAPFVQFEENFDELPLKPFFTAGTWGTTQEVAYNGTSCLADSPGGTHGPNQHNYIIFAPVIITESNKNLHFAHIASLHTSAGDFGAINISTDQMQSWNTIASYDANSYPESFKERVTESQWVVENKSLDAYVGDTLYLQFVLFSNAIIHWDGWYIDALAFNDDVSSVNETIDFKTNIVVEAYPNPVNEQMTLKLYNSLPGYAMVDIFDAIGNHILFVANEELSIGTHNYDLNLSALANGTYFARVTINGRSKVIPIVVSK